MNHHEIIFYWLTVGFEAALCVLVYFRNVARRLPFFSIYAAVLLICNLGIGFIYWHFGFRSAIAYYAFWITVSVGLLARSSAIVELCRYRLRAYRGIWTFAWPLFILLVFLFIANGAWDAWGQPNWIATYGLTIRRDVDITSVVILAAMLLIRDYYGIPVESLQKWIAVGISCFCLIEIVNNTVLRDHFIKYMLSWDVMKPQFERMTDVWNAIQTFATVVSISIWCFALKKPLPALSQEPVLLPSEVYGKLSPAVNLRLRAFNDRLLDMLKP